MKKLLSLFILMLLPMLASAQTASDVQNSGCLSKTRGEEAQMEPTIILTKEGSTLSVQLLNYESNCATQDFNVSSQVAYVRSAYRSQYMTWNRIVSILIVGGTKDKWN